MISKWPQNDHEIAQNDLNGFKVTSETISMILSPRQARRELNPSQVSNLSSHQREPQEVDDTCISGDSLKGSAEQIISNRS